MESTLEPHPREGACKLCPCLRYTSGHQSLFWYAPFGETKVQRTSFLCLQGDPAMQRVLASLAILLSASLCAGAEQLVPAGSTMQCMVSDKISSKTMAVGDPVLCEVSHTEAYGRFVFPYGSYLVGRFEEYKDPGHFVGKGWMELKFDHLVVGNDTNIPINARVVATSDKYPVDMEGRIHGTGHPVRDTVEWMIPVLWPIDLINLPRRGPNPVLKPETRLTLKLLDDVGLPTRQEVQHQPELVSRFNYSDPAREQEPAPIQREAAPTYAPYAPQMQQPAPIQQAYAQPSPTVIVVQAPAPAPTIIQQAAAPVVVQQPRQPVFYPYPAPVPYGYPAYPPAYYRYYRPY